MGKLITGFVLLIAALAAAVYLLFSLTLHYRRIVQSQFDELSRIVDAQDPVKVRAQLASMIDEQAQINLEVYFPIPGQKHTPQPPQPFSKTDFLNFVDNTLYTVNDYHFSAQIGELTLAADKTTAHLNFSAHSRAHGVSTALMEASSQFSTESDCQANVVLDSKAPPKLTALTCEVRVMR